MIGTIRSRTLTLVAVAAGAALLGTAVPAQADLGAPTRTDTRTVTRSPMPAPRLVDISTGRHTTFDRVVFKLRGDSPGYTVGYVRRVRADGSGNVVPLRGKANLLVRLTPADAHNSAGAPTYTGPRHIYPGYPQLREVAFVGDFEATVSIGLGLRHKAGFRVFTLHSPTRIVVDVAH
ncbi:MAG: hypothetical protein QOJ03_439 [Frankiaceae bacterium]|jgi:hypothetical protein|nr:hypothetical protein [Frankiaceae bacterium]